MIQNVSNHHYKRKDSPATMDSLLTVTMEDFSVAVRASTSAAHPRLDAHISREGKVETTPFCQK